MSFNKNRAARRQLRALLPLAMGQKEPPSFAVGVQRPPLDIPTNVVIFCRHFRKQLPSHLPNVNLDQTVLILSLQGEGTAHLDHQPIRFVAGQALTIFPQQIHSYSDIDGDRLVWLVITFQVQHGEALAPLRNAPVPLTPAALTLIRKLIVEYRQRRPAATNAAAIAITLWHLILELLSHAGPARPSGAPTLTEERVARVQRYIVDHIRDPIRIRDLAREMGVSESKLCIDFRRFVHVGLGTYIRRWRVFYACRLMQAASAKLAAVATQCGFTSVYAFSRTFKQVMRIAPSDWRQHYATKRAGPRRG